MVFLRETTIEEVDLPKRLYKYRIWDKVEHKRLLTQNEIKFSAPFDCDEQHECNLPRDYDSVKEKMLFEYYYLTAPDMGYKSLTERFGIANYMMKNSPFHSKGHRIYIEEKFRQELNKQLSLFCTSPHKNNLNLWSSFAGGDSGFCVGFNTRKMFDTKEIFGSGGKVNYFPLNELPKIRPFCFTDEERIADMMQVVYTLPDIFAKEDEYRLTKMNIHIQTVQLNIDSFEEIILSEHINNTAKAEIIEIAKSRIPKAEISQAKFNLNTEDYDFIPIAAGNK